MSKSVVLTVAMALLAGAAGAQPAPLKPGLAGVAFLIGDWSSGRGKVAETGQTSTGSSTIEPVAGGAALLRRDHTNLFDASGKPAGGFDQVMMIYPQGETLRADYIDGGHVIHYTSAVIVAGRSVTFASETQAGAPAFRLSYTLAGPATLAVSFSMAPPGTTEFHPIATGTLTKGG
jgi:hypothetical protein